MGGRSDYRGSRMREFDSSTGHYVFMRGLPYSASEKDIIKVFFYWEFCGFLCEVAEGSAAAFERELAGFPSAHVGEVTDRGSLRVSGVRGATVIDVRIDELRRAHQSGFQG